MILDDIIDVIEEECKKHTAKEVARHFDKEHKWVYSVKNGCSFVLNAEFVAGLKHYGYVLELKKVGAK